MTVCAGRALLGLPPASAPLFLPPETEGGAFLGQAEAPQSVPDAVTSPTTQKPYLADWPARAAVAMTTGVQGSGREARRDYVSQQAPRGLRRSLTEAPIPQRRGGPKAEGGRFCAACGAGTRGTVRAAPS